MDRIINIEKPLIMITNNKLILLVIFLSITLTSHTQEISYKTVYDIPYYEDSIINSDKYIEDRCKLDIYYPENEKEFTTVVWFHGGGLTGGSKELPEYLKDRKSTRLNSSHVRI